MASLWLNYRSTRFPLRRGEMLIGRSPYCTIIIDSPQVSRQHCALYLKGDELTLHDLGSSNGTFVNGERLTGRRTMRPGDYIQLGTEVIELLALSELEVSLDAPRIVTDRPAPRDRRRPPEPEATLSMRATLELIEGLAESAGQLSQPVGMIRPIQHAIETLAQPARTEASPLSKDEQTRILAVIARLEPLVEDPAYGLWRQQVERWLAERAGG